MDILLEKGMTGELAGRIRRGRQIEEMRLRSVDNIPANWQAAQVHYRAARFGALNTTNYSICPCCNDRVENIPFSICNGTSNPLMGSDIVLFFSFVRTIIIYLVLHLLMSSMYNLKTNFEGRACRDQHNCPKIFLTLLATSNKLRHFDPLQMLDLLNLCLVGASIFFFIVVRRIEYQRYNQIEAEIQTENSYSLYIDQIPLLLYSQQRQKMDYVYQTRKYFDFIIRDWLNKNRSGSQDPIFLSYQQAAMKHQHDAFNPPSIVANVNLSWNLSLIRNLQRQKELLKDKVESNMAQGYLSMSLNKNQQINTAQRLGVANLINLNFRQSLDAVNQALMDMNEKYDMDRSFDFCLSKFVGKAFVSFQYQQFAAVILDKAQSQGLQFGPSELLAEPASDPTDIDWEDMHESPEQASTRNKNTFWLTAGSLLFAFVSILMINYGRNRWIQRIEDIGLQKASLWVNVGTIIGVAVFITFVNWLLCQFIWSLVEYEVTVSFTNKNRAYIIKTLIAQFINTAISYLAVSSIVQSNLWERSGIVIQVSVLFIFTTLLQLITNLIYLPAWKRLWNLSHYIYGSPVPLFQDRFNQIFALPEFHLTDRFIYYILQVYLVCFFSYLIPICVPILLIAVILHYFIDQINLFYRSSFTIHFNFKLIRTMYKLLEASILIFAVGNAIWSKYFNLSFKRPFNIAALAVALIYCIVIFILRYRWEIKILCTRVRFQLASYSDCVRQRKFQQTYDSENPATSLLFYTDRQFAYSSSFFPNQASQIPVHTSQMSNIISGHFGQPNLQPGTNNAVIYNSNFAPLQPGLNNSVIYNPNLNNSVIYNPNFVP